MQKNMCTIAPSEIVYDEMLDVVRQQNKCTIAPSEIVDDELLDVINSKEHVYY